LKDTSAILKRIILRVKIDRAVTKSDNINLRKLNKKKDRGLKKGRMKYKNGD